MVRPHLGALGKRNIIRCCRWGFLPNRLGGLLAKTEFYKAVHRWLRRSFRSLITVVKQRTFVTMYSIPQLMKGPPRWSAAALEAYWTLCLPITSHFRSSRRYFLPPRNCQSSPQLHVLAFSIPADHPFQQRLSHPEVETCSLVRSPKSDLSSGRPPLSASSTDGRPAVPTHWSKHNSSVHA